MNFYSELQRLLDQVPDDAYTTTLELSQAMGDLASATAIRESLLRPDFRRYSDKVNERSHHFTSFQTCKPLLKLAEKQAELAKMVVEEDVLSDWQKVAGVDAAYLGDHVYAACVVVDRSGHIVSEDSADSETRFPYVPGYFYYREGPALAAAIRRLNFDVLMVNAHGVAHPRRLGLASQFGLELGKPTLGVSTSLLIGEINRRREGVSNVFLDGSQVGVRLDGKPTLIVSVGHMISLGNATSIVEAFWNKVGLPRPLALAHEHARKQRETTSK